VRALGRPVFVKPFDFDELEDTIRTWTRISGGHPAISNVQTERDFGAR
jgi:hypothetical protein